MKLHGALRVQGVLADVQRAPPLFCLAMLVARARLNRPNGMRTCLQLPAYGYYQIPIHL
jgi:hypothetical protein